MVHRVVRHVEVWSVAKVAAAFAACGYVIGMISGYLLWRAADRVGTIDGIEAVVDKDRVSALLGAALGADRLFLTTGTDAIYRDFASENRQRIASLTVSEVCKMADEGQFPPGSMGPKVEAAVNFLACGGRASVVCSPPKLVDAFGGQAGTQIIAD